jgi:hypothetical protein
VSQGGHLKQPLGLVLAPNGNILTANAGDGNIVETTPAGKQLLADPADPKSGAGSLFGLDVAANGAGVYFVDAQGRAPTPPLRGGCCSPSPRASVGVSGGLRRRPRR